MDKANIDYRFACKLLNICANKALMEDALETRETILCAAELVRYIFDIGKTIVPLSKEVEMAEIYINSFLLSGQNEHAIALQCHIVQEVYVDHLALLSFIIHDSENSLLIFKPKEITYRVDDDNELRLSKIMDGKALLEFQLTKR